MSIELLTYPACPYYADASIFIQSAGATVRSPLGGDSQRVNRLGDRFGMTVRYPPMHSDDVARKLVAQLNQGLSQGVIASWPQVDFDPGVPGLPLVAGGGQAGAELDIDAIGVGYSFRYGQFGNFTAGGRLHLFQITADVPYTTGAATLPILPLMRKSPADNSAVSFADVKIEGWLEGDGREWTVSTARHVGLEFTVVEK